VLHIRIVDVDVSPAVKQKLKAARPSDDDLDQDSADESVGMDIDEDVATGTADVDAVQEASMDSVVESKASRKRKQPVSTHRNGKGKSVKRASAEIDDEDDVSGRGPQDDTGSDDQGEDEQKQNGDSKDDDHVAEDGMNGDEPQEDSAESANEADADAPELFSDDEDTAAATAHASSQAARIASTSDEFIRKFVSLSLTENQAAALQAPSSSFQRVRLG